MTKLCFKYGTMNSSKTAQLLMTAHNYRSQGKKVLLIKPTCDTRFGSNMIKSRAGPEMEADLLITPDISNISHLLTDVVCILVDEAQFLSIINIDMLRGIAMSINVICYGLRTDYMCNLFPASKRLLEIADYIEEMTSVCVACDQKALVNAKFTLDLNGDKHIIREGSCDIDLGAEEKYQAMCWSCWIEA